MRISPLLIANTSRWLARITTLPAIFLICIYLLFAWGYTMDERAGSQTILVYLFALLGVSAGLIIVDWNEKSGSLIGFVSFLALFFTIGFFVSIEDMQGDFTTFLFLLLPIGLFFISYAMRRKLQGGCGKVLAGSCLRPSLVPSTRRCLVRSTAANASR